VRQNYLEQAKTYPQRYRVIDATARPEAVHAAVMAVLAGGQKSEVRRQKTEDASSE
jgi:thymidylate kinase